MGSASAFNIAKVLGQKRLNYELSQKRISKHCAYDCPVMKLIINNFFVANDRKILKIEIFIKITSHIIKLHNTFQ